MTAASHSRRVSDNTSLAAPSEHQGRPTKVSCDGAGTREANCHLGKPSALRHSASRLVAAWYLAALLSRVPVVLSAVIKAGKERTFCL